MKIWTITMFLVFVLSRPAFGQMNSQYSPYELDTLEAHLNQQWKRAEEVGTAYSRFKGIRENVANVYQAEMKDWFVQLAAWYTAWEPILAQMKANGLIDSAARKKTMNQLKAQEVELGRLRGRITEINKKGDAALDAFKDLPHFPGNYVDILENSNTDNYSQNLDLYNRQVDGAIAKVRQTKESFTDSILKGLDKVTAGLDAAVETKAKSLASDHPDLKVALQSLQASIVQSRKADALIARMRTNSVTISDLVNEGAIYTAQDAMDHWKKEIADSVSALRQDPAVSPNVADYAATMLNSLVNVRAGQISDQLAQRSALVIFAGFYENQLYGSENLVGQCLASEKPRGLDCNRLRMIQGFTNDQLMLRKDTEAAYVESLLIKAKRGIYKI